MILGAFLFVLCTQIITMIKGELFTSNAHLQTALYAERDIANLLKSYVEKEEARLEQIKKLADDYNTHSTKALENIDRHLGNPINAFLLIKRFTLDWDKDVLPVLSNNSKDDLNEEIQQIRSDLPTYEDLKGAASALMRLQDTYHLDTSTVAHGNLGGVRSPVLTAAECFLLGKLSYGVSDFYHSSLWMQAALERDSQEQRKTASRTDTLDYLSYTKAVLGDLPQALELTNQLLRIDPKHERATNNKKYFEAMIEENKSKSPKENKKPGYQANRDEYRNSQEFLTYEALCRGENAVEVKNADKLTCQYVTKNHPLLLLQPAKEETVHLDPWVVIYHNVMSDEEIRQIKHLATPRLNRATVQNAKTGELETANYRISKSAWLRGEEHPVVQRLNDRMEAITGLDLSTAEELQIANYGLGGHYEPHFDFARREEKKDSFDEKYGNRIATFLIYRKKKSWFDEIYGNRIATFLNYKEEKDAFKSLGTGNRIATFLNYMSDVEAGGATVFPYIGLKLFPKKGDAAFWFNLYSSGEGIYNTRHAACPVLVGTKWVANKWIHERGQEFRRPCGLEYEV